jgi:pimeloyl-ACP methyl ester carboxylesterase
MKNIRWTPLGVVILCATLGCSSSSDGELAPPAKTFVLVHGSWMGAWCWDDVAAGLRAKGETVVTVELPAHGADTTPLPGATLDAYVAKVGAAVDAAEGPVILVGHSMAGMVVTQVAENKTDKIAKLVYLAAYLPKDGQTLFDLAMTDADSHSGMNVVLDMTDGLAKIPSDDLQDDFLADGSPAELATLQAHYRDEPLAPFVTPVHTTVANWGRLPKVYVYTKEDHAVSYTLQQRMTAGVTFVSTATLDTSHAPFLSQPALVTSTLLGL